MGRKKKAAANSASKSQRPAHYDIDFIRSAARGRAVDILSRLGGLPSAILDGRHHPCPKCGGTDRFRLLDTEAGAIFCNQCANGGIGDVFASLEWVLNKKFADVLPLVADYLGIEPDDSASYSSNGHAHADPAEHLTFQPWDEASELLTAYWCLTKPPITVAAIRAVGGQLARYRGQYTVIALPVHGESLDKTKPVGWCLYNVTGGPLPKWSRRKSADDQPSVPEWVKVKLTHGSQPGIIADLSRLQSAVSVDAWKLEGPTDLLAFLTLPDLPADSIALTNANGSKENPPVWVLNLFTGHRASVLHDADKPGQAGSLGWTDQRSGRRHNGWAPSIATTAAECRNVSLPYPIAPDHGKDLRDYLTEPPPRQYADLQALAAAASIIPRTDLPPAAIQPLESDDDPHRLARVNLDRYAKHREGATLRFWRDEWYTWKQTRGAYRKIAERELRAKMIASIRSEFEIVWQAKMAEYEARRKADRLDDNEQPPTVQKVTKTLVSNVIDATGSLVVVSSATDQMTWIDEGGRERRNYVAMANGILDIESALADAELTDCLLPHTPKWFSSICLPYAFNQDAECPKWEAFLEKNLELDPERIKILQEWAGYLLLPDTGEQKFLVLEGEGANGKSVWLAAMTAMLGADNCSHIPLELFADRFAKSQTLGKLVNISADVGELDKVAEGYLKSFTSGDVMYFDRKGIPGVDCTPSARLMLACNNRPRFSDRSSGIWRRMLLIPWRITITRQERIRNMDKPWWWEQSGELPGIFNWALVGLARLRTQQGFTDSSLSTEALEDYRIESNPARAFLKENLEPHDNSGVKCTFLYRLYHRWASDHGYKPMGERVFGKEVRRVFERTERKRGGSSADRYWYYDTLRFQQAEICGEQTHDGSLF
jgi:P4 family phage/plasmid primase-like protien